MRAITAAARRMLLTTAALRMLLVAVSLAAVVPRHGEARQQTANVPSDEMKLFKLAEGTTGGRCNDGSPASWYYGSPANETVSDWVIFLMGGGACRDAKKCHARLHGRPSLMGSGAHKPTKITGRKRGNMKQASTWILSDDAQVNPDFYHAHKVYVNYCSSDEFSGTQTEASAETFGFYFSGHLNLVNIFGELKKQHPTTFGSAAHVLLTGGSAGGIGTLLNIDWARDQFPSSTVVKGAPMGGWFVPGDAPDQAQTWNPPSKWPDWSKGKVTAWPQFDASAGLPWRGYINKACAQALGASASFRCASAHVVYPHIQTPVYVMENNYDSFQVGPAEMLFDAADHSQRSQDYVRYFGRAMRNSTAVVRQKPSDALFLPSCFDHTRGLYATTRMNNKTGGQLLGEWFNGRMPASDRILVDDCGELPCNPTCTNWPAGPAPAPALGGKGSGGGKGNHGKGSGSGSGSGKANIGRMTKAMGKTCAGNSYSSGTAAMRACKASKCSGVFSSKCSISAKTGSFIVCTGAADTWTQGNDVADCVLSPGKRTGKPTNTHANTAHCADDTAKLATALQGKVANPTCAMVKAYCSRQSIGAACPRTCGKCGGSSGPKTSPGPSPGGSSAGSPCAARVATTPCPRGRMTNTLSAECCAWVSVFLQDCKTDDTVVQNKKLLRSLNQASHKCKTASGMSSS